MAVQLASTLPELEGQQACAVNVVAKIGLIDGWL